MLYIRNASTNIYTELGRTWNDLASIKSSTSLAKQSQLIPSACRNWPRC